MNRLETNYPKVSQLFINLSEKNQKKVILILIEKLCERLSINDSFTLDINKKLVVGSAITKREIAKLEVNTNKFDNEYLDLLDRNQSNYLLPFERARLNSALHFITLSFDKSNRIEALYELLNCYEEPDPVIKLILEQN